MVADPATPDPPAADPTADPPADTRVGPPADTPAGPPEEVRAALLRLSHDIRSAMSDVIGGLRLMEPGRLDPQSRTQVLRVRAAADTLAALVDDALMVASGEVFPRPDPAGLNLEEWLDALAGRWRGRAAERGRDVTLVRIGALPDRLLVAPLDLDRIIGNLVDNALVHVPQGDVRVEVAHAVDAAPGLTIRVLDDGPGFPASVLANVARGLSAGAHGAGAGSGLGLGIASSLGARIGAVLRLANDPVTGSGVASLRIPSALLHSDRRAAPPQDQAPDLGGLRILVAEDNPTNQVLLRRMLEGMRARIVLVGDGQAAVEALAAGPFDIGLIDIEMPVKSGLEVMEEVRAGPEPGATMPLVAITAYVLRDNREAIYAAGADGIIGKPIASAAEFGRAILRHLGRPVDAAPDLGAMPRPGASGDGGGEDAGDGIDHVRLDRLLAEAGAEGRMELLDRLAEDLAEVRLRLDAGIAAPSIPEIRAQTHILIAISGAVGADRLCRRAESLNIAAKRRRSEALSPLYLAMRADLDALVDLIGRLRAPRA